MERITVDHLSFAYPETDRLILDDVCIEAQAGDFVCLLGQSGCGKSTLLRLLAGLETPTKGRIVVGDKEIKGPGLDRSVVFQDYGLFPWMSAGENIVLALQQRFPEKSKAECRDMAMNAIREVGLSEDAYGKYPKELSGGMQQRCAIARSFSLNPPILLMDEPFGALDAVTRARLQDMVLNLWSHEAQRKTVFFVTHDVEEALLLATKICVLGQSPSKVIFTGNIPIETKPNRQEIYKDKNIAELRTVLIEHINSDVVNHVGD